ncbi:MAG: hypothetical protein ACRDL7_03815 [Gaiellaceae bacterium]
MATQSIAAFDKDASVDRRSSTSSVQGWSCRSSRRAGVETGVGIGAELVPGLALGLTLVSKLGWELVFGLRSELALGPASELASGPELEFLLGLASRLG